MASPEFEWVGLRYSVLTQETSFLAVDAWGALSNDTTANEDAGGDFAAADGAQSSSIVGTASFCFIALRAANLCCVY